MSRPLTRAVAGSGAARVVLAAGFVVLLFNSGQRFSMGLMLKPMAEDLGWTRSTLSLVMTTFLVLSALALPFAGRMVDRHGAGVVLGVSVVLAGTGTALMHWIQTPMHAFVLYGVVFALGSAGTSITPVGVLINRWFPRRIGLANSVAISGMGVGQLVVVSVLAVWLASLGWREAFLWLGVLSVVAVLPLVFWVSRLRRAAPDSDAGQIGGGDLYGPRTLRTALATPKIWVLFAIYAICGFQDFFMATHVVAFALDRGVSSEVSGNMLAFMGLMGLAGVLLTGTVSDRFGPTRPTAACFALRVILFGGIALSQHAAVIVIFALLFGATFWVTAPMTVVFVRDGYGTALLGTLAGMVTMVHHMFGGLGAYVGAASFDLTGRYDGAFLANLGASVLALALTVVLPRARGATGLKQLSGSMIAR